MFDFAAETNLRNAPVEDIRLDHMIVGTSPSIKRLKQVISRLAPSQSAVLVQGPTGAGKEVITQALHMVSERKGPLVAVNCAAIPEELLESELFGHEKGAFTGASERRIGRVEQANGGTLFLDEIGDMPLSLQAKLLRVLETRRIQRLGGREEVSVDFRLVTATHRDLNQEVLTGRFRQDLFYRIAVFSLAVPALSERMEDIEPILEAMARRVRADQGPNSTASFSAEAIRFLQSYSWPGNVRELRNVFDRACVLFGGTGVSAEDCRMSLMGPEMGEQAAPSGQATRLGTPDANGLRQVLEAAPSVNLRGYLQDIEAGLIEAALELNKGCVAHAAKALRLKRTTMIEKMKKLGIERQAA